MANLPTYHPIRVLRRHRRGIATCLAALSVGLVALATRPPVIPMVQVMVADRAIAAGSRIEASDLRAVSIPARLAQGALADSGAAIGQLAAVAIAAGEPISAARLLNRELADDPQSPQNVPMPLRLADTEAAGLLRPGNRIDVIATSSPEGGGPAARVVAREVLVLSLPEVGQQAMSAGPSGRLTLVSVDPQEAVALAGAAAGGQLTFVVTR